jgi:hypothetical protein
MTKKCKTVFSEYVDGLEKYYFYINGYLRQGNSFFDKNLSWRSWFGQNKTKQEAEKMIKDRIKTMDECFIKYGKHSKDNNNNTIVYRGMKDTFYLKDDSTHPEIGETIKIDTYTSTSSELRVANGFANMNNGIIGRTGTTCCLYEFQLDKDVPYLDMDCCIPNYKTEDSEFEILLPRNIYLTYVGIRMDYLLPPPKYNPKLEAEYMRNLYKKMLNTNDVKLKKKIEHEIAELEKEKDENPKTTIRTFYVSTKHP